jgi:hypothetical protein
VILGTRNYCSPLGAAAREWPLAIIAVYLLLATRPLLHGEFGIVDDHEIMMFLGPSRHLTLPGVAGLVQARVLETNGRFRPGYYLLRIAETFLLGNHARLWYLDRILFALVSAACIYLVCRQFIPPIFAALATLLFFCGPQNEIWYRLGPNETYAILVLSIGLAWLVRKDERERMKNEKKAKSSLTLHRSSLVTPLTGPLLLLACIGFIKESFIPVFPAVLVFVYVLRRLTAQNLIPKWSAGDLALLAGLLLVVATQIAATLYMVREYGHVYGGALSGDGIWMAARQSVLQYSKDTLWFIPVLFAVVATARRRAFNQKRDASAKEAPSPTCQASNKPGFRADFASRPLLILGALLAGGVLILVPQWIFYGSTGFGIGGRYLTPGNFFVPYAVVLSVWLVAADPLSRKHLSANSLCRAGIAVCLLVMIVLRGLDFHHWCNASAAHTRLFQERLQQVVDLKTRHPGARLIFIADSAAAYEPIVSVQRFLAVRLGTPERPFVEWSKSNPSPATALENKIATKLKTLAKEGNTSFRGRWEDAALDTARIEVMFSAGRLFSSRFIDVTGDNRRARGGPGSIQRIRKYGQEQSQ